MKLGLGTAQFGMRYGVSNRRGKVSGSEVPDILALAAANGIDLLDTAPAYGDSERVLGASLRSSGSFRLVTKMSARPAGRDGAELFSSVHDQLQGSLHRIGRDSVYGYLVHDARDLGGDRGGWIVEALDRQKAASRVAKVGVSVYTPAELDAVLDRFVPDIVQLPLSIFNQRFLEGRMLCELKRRGVEIHARSIFMQGLVLMESDDLGDYFEPIRDRHRAFSRFVQDAGMTKLEVALGFLAGIAEVDVALVGVTGSRELRQIIDAAGRSARQHLRLPDARAWAINDEDILNPALWPGAVTGDST